MKAAGLVSSSGGINSPNLHYANKSTAAGTALAIAYKKSIWDVSMEDFVVFSTAPETPFERLVSYTMTWRPATNTSVPVRKHSTGLESLHYQYQRLTYIPSWVPRGYGQQNMYMAPHKCRIINANGGKRDLRPQPKCLVEVSKARNR
jgi:hypothetical protein